MASANCEHAPLVSVVIVAYNQQDFIAEAIQSAVDQDYPNLEVVVADDASTDDTPAIIAEFQVRFPKRVVPVLNTVNGGITANCNSALRACRGKYIAFMGGDDVLLAGKIAAQVAWMEADPERVMCGHQVEVFYHDGSPSHPLMKSLPEGTGAEHILRHGTYGAVSVMVRAAALPPYGFEPKLKMVSDYMLYVEILAKGGSFGAVPGTLARYRKHSANVTNRVEKLAGDLATYFDLIEQRYPQYAALARRGRVRNLLYDVGVSLLRQGRKAEARTNFLAAIRSEPTFFRAWIRAAQTFV